MLLFSLREVTQDGINTIKKPSFYHFYGKILPAYTI